MLVENDGVLPLRPDVGRIAVIGPIADSPRDLLGDYAHLPHIETLAELRHQANPFGFPSSDVINPVDELSGMPTILGGLRDRFGADRIVHASGRACARAATQISPRPSSSLAARTSRSSCSANGPG